MPSDGEPVLEVRGLRVAFGDDEVVHGVDLTIGAGERVALVGGSGSGKSTTALAVLGLLPAGGRVTAGSVRFRGEDITTAGPRRLRELRGAGIGLVPQDPLSGLDPVRRVGTQVATALRAHGLAESRRDARGRAVDLLAAAGIPEPARRAVQYPHELSGGMRQRVLVTIALACRPALLLADEPTSALDVTVARRILDLVGELTASSGTSLLLVTHDLGLAAERADRVVVLRDGRVAEAGGAARVLRSPTDDYTRALIDASPGLSPGAPRAVAGALPDTAPVLELDGVSHRFRLRGGHTVHALDDVSFAVAPGTTTAVVGESGSGKTTAARIALGLLAPSSGTVRLDGRETGVRSGLDRAERRTVAAAVQPVLQDPFGSLDPTWTVASLIAEPLRVHGHDGRGARVAELLDAVALPATTGRRVPRELSGGQRQRVAIARALALEPQLVVCDEAVSALDVLVQDQVLRLLEDLQERLGLAYLFISHDLGVVRRIADRVVVMRSGRVEEQGPAARVLEAPEAEYTRELLAAVPGRAA
ncbi:ABC transporter ATP-binding protein [Actinomycetospora sp. NBRC 106378]|uniref:ATP-binding cassette domain-containing protein n=1 Tax=Actinomycetospora sp. NBRC 106378 TaxID=3032208 RepID=UPI0024A1921B|nr:ABC transporter ATP-binding protein [Actinomycetospora sp. NBRC 106378]GLZ54414.1 peptide ABC transporter ATP-binding protein [Actinomycetospora sp. NBRC 106378]